MKPSTQEKIALFLFRNDDNIVLAFKLVAIIILFSLIVLMVWFGLFCDIGSEFLCQFLLPILAVFNAVSLFLLLGMFCLMVWGLFVESRFCLMVWGLFVESSPNFMWTIYGVLAGFLFFASTATHSMAVQKITQMQDDQLCQVCVEAPATTSAEKPKPGK